MSDARPYRVSLRRCEDYDPPRVREAVRALLAPLGGMRAFVADGRSVLLKPNLIVPRPAEAAVTTHPEIVRAVALEVLEAGGRPLIGDSPAFSSARAVAQACGIGAVAEELGLEIVDLGRGAKRCRLAESGPFRHAGIGRAAREADVIVNLPKIKAHVQTGMSLGVKNMYGCVAGKRKAFFHFRNGPDARRFGVLLTAVCRRLAPALTLADGVVSLENHGPTHGDPRATAFLAAGAHPAAVDHAVVALLGVSPERVPYLAAAAEMGYGPRGLEEIELAGDALEALRVADFGQVPPERIAPINFSLPRVLKSCARQIAYLIQARRAGH